MTDDVTPYKRPPSTRKVHRGLQAMYLAELTDIRSRREALLDLRRQDRVLTLKIRIRQLSKGWAKDPEYLNDVQVRRTLREDIHTRDNELSDLNKSLRNKKVALKQAERAHLETRLALKTPALNTAFTNLSILRGEAAQRDREYKEAQEAYKEAQRELDETNRRKNLAERSFQDAIATYHSYMRGRVRKKAKKVAAKAPEARP